MTEFIDHERRLSPEEHYCLYTYSRSQPGGKVSYRDFCITEELIGRYNRAPADEKQRIWARMCHDADYPAFLRAFQERPWEFEKPVLWSDRPKTPYFIRQLSDSHAFEVYIAWLFSQRGVDIGLYYGREQQYHRGETAAGIEIKYDKRSEKTGNYYIEYQERMHADGIWVDSGILKQDDTRFYLLGTIEQFVIFERSWLMEYYRRLVCGGERLGDARLVAEKAHGTSKGFILRPEASRCGNIPIERLIRDYRLAEQFPADTGAAPRGAIPGESGPDM